MSTTTLSTSNPQVSLKLFIDKSRRKILFGEADKNFIDFLFSILALPIGTTIDLITAEAMTGPLRNLYHSVQNLNANYFQDNHCKNALLKPNLDHIPKSRITLFSIESSLIPKEYYICSSNLCRSHYISTKSNVRCPHCTINLMNTRAKLGVSDDEIIMVEESSSGRRGYMKEMISYLVMQDLTVKPMSIMSGVSMLADQLGVVDMGTIEEKVVYLDIKEGLDFLRASLCSSSTVLSDVFLHQIDFGSSTKTVSDKEVAQEKTIKKEGNPPLAVFL